MDPGPEGGKSILKCRSLNCRSVKFDDEIGFQDVEIEHSEEILCELPPIALADLSPEQRPVYEDMRAGIEKNFQGFRTIAENGALMGRGIRGCTTPSSGSRSGS